jgi:hypothetical protein
MVNRSRRTIAEYEGGDDAPLSVILAWAEATGVDVMQLVTRRPTDAATRGRSRHTRNATIRDARSGHPLVATRAA